MMRKRERENPCGICGHYHKYEEGEVCGICGHRLPDSSSSDAAAAVDRPSVHISAFPSEILPDFLYLGSYDNAARSELLKTQGISRILNVSLAVDLNSELIVDWSDWIRYWVGFVPACQNLYKNSFTYHCLQDDKTLQFDEAIQILEQCERDKARILVHCMSGKSRSPAIVISYLMKSKGWRLAQSYQWVKERRPAVELTEGVHQQLQQYEQRLFSSADNAAPVFPPPSFSFGFPKAANDTVPFPSFTPPGTTSVFAQSLDIPPQEFKFGAGSNPKSPSNGDITMDT
ncbi:Protein-tyrosine-phosphatase IBR5 [Linum perenne]